MIAQWVNDWISLSVLSVARVQFPCRQGGVFQLREFSLTDDTLPTHPKPARQKIAQAPLNDTTQPVDSEEEGRSSTTDRKWLK